MVFYSDKNTFLVHVNQRYIILNYNVILELKVNTRFLKWTSYKVKGIEVMIFNIHIYEVFFFFPK